MVEVVLFLVRVLCRFERTCLACGGRGKVISSPCKKCASSGRVLRSKSISFDLPPGIMTGNRLQISGRGEAGVNQGKHGDLYVVVSVLPHKLF